MNIVKSCQKEFECDDRFPFQLKVGVNQFEIVQRSAQILPDSTLYNIKGTCGDIYTQSYGIFINALSRLLCILACIWHVISQLLQTTCDMQDGETDPVVLFLL